MLKLLETLKEEMELTMPMPMRGRGIAVAEEREVAIGTVSYHQRFNSRICLGRDIEIKAFVLFCFVLFFFFLKLEDIFKVFFFFFFFFLNTKVLIKLLKQKFNFNCFHSNQFKGIL